MTDTGAVIRALKLGHPAEVISESLGITPETVEVISKEFEEIKSAYDKGITWAEAASSLMKDKGEVWYAYHVIESSDEELEEEVKAENVDGKPRLKPPHIVDEAPPPKKNPKGGPRAKKETKTPPKEKIDEGLTKQAEGPTGERLMERTGEIAKSLALKEQQIGQFVMDTMDPVMRELGIKDHIEYLQMLLSFFLENNSKIDHINELEQTIETLTILLDERNRKAFIAKQTDNHVLELVSRGLPVKAENLLEYAKYLENQIRPVNNELTAEEN